MPGTIGTLLGVPMAFIISLFKPLSGAVIVVIITVLAIFFASWGKKILRGSDPPKIVIDEVSGFLAASYLVPFTVINMAVVFIFFRIFDILKPFPIGYIDRRFKGATGIVLDDVMAGVYANISAQVVIKFIL